MTDSVVTTPAIDSQEVADGTMSILIGALKGAGRVKYPMVSRRPAEYPTEVVSLMIAPLLNRKREDIGTVRIYVIVRKDSGDVRIRVEWTRHAFGFWFRDSIRFKVVDGNGAWIVPVVPASDISRVLHWIKQTADGTTTLKGQLNVLKKIKKNAVKDRAAGIGLVLG